MSFYNLLFGVSPAAVFILPMLGKHPDAYGRFRDCFLYDSEHPEYDGFIQVYTRLGRGNREAFQEKIDEIRQIPGYVTDYDDSFDCTYATFVFKAPKEYTDDLNKILVGDISYISDAYKERIYKMFPSLRERLDRIFYPTDSEDQR